MSTTEFKSRKKWALLRKLIRKLKSVRLPLFDGLPFWDVMVFFIQGLQKGALNIRASSMAFSFFLAIFPAIIFLFTLIAYIPIDNFQGQLLSLLEEFMPYNAYQASRETIEDIVKQRRGGLLSFGFIFALYFATNGINAMIEAFNRTFHSVRRRKALQQRFVAILLTVILSVLLLVSIALIIFSQVVMGYLVKNGFMSKDNYLVLLLVNWFVSIALVYFATSFVYYLGPSRHTRWNFFSAGSSLATLLIILTSYGFSVYINHFNQYNKLYGSIGTLIIVLLWLYINSFLLLIGFELNASIERAKQTTTKDSPSTEVIPSTG
ncbi:MAG: YihY/virulence factor BrkB family protein [Bacteroidia bacterium]|nr:YihY/virulence factor BrkB family protein [Bacteroidia bacterium]